MLKFLSNCGQSVRVISASHRTAAQSPGDSDYPLSVYGENLRQLEGQLALSVGQRITGVVVLRFGKILVREGSSVTDLWGDRLAPGGPEVDCLPLEDAVNAFVCARSLDVYPATFWVASIASGQTFSINGGAMPQGQGAWPLSGSLDMAREVLHWMPDREHLRRIIRIMTTGEDMPR